MQKWPEIYTDGSKLDGRAGAAVHSTCLALKTPIRLPDHCSVFQAEICAIHVAINGLKTNGQSVSDVCILSDSQAALRALDSPHITSRSVITCRISLDEIATQMNICLCWVSGTFQATVRLMSLQARVLLQNFNDYGIPIATLKLKFEEVLKKSI